MVIFPSPRCASRTTQCQGRLGTGSTANQLQPTAVDTSGVLAGKQIVQVAAGQAFAVALDAEGLVYAWGNGTSVQLGDGLSAISTVPVAVDASGVRRASAS